MRVRGMIVAALLVAGSVPALAGSAVFLHPDGMGAGTWAATRLLNVGPDGRLAWDRLPATAIYVGPHKDQVTGTSHGGATTHAWGVRVAANSYGMDAGRPIAAARSGAAMPLMLEAKRAGKRIGIVNSASLAEPGTGAMIASVVNRRDQAAIMPQLLAAGPDVMLGGGEEWWLPVGTQGRHGPGRRTDDRNLVTEARAQGYTVVFTADELARVPATVTKLIGLFAAGDTFNEGSAGDLAKAGGLLRPGAPDWDVMVARALAILSRPGAEYLLVANHEATDNLGGDNASGVLAAASAADRAIAAVAAQAARDPKLTLVVASDSDCGAMAAVDDGAAGASVPATGEKGMRLEGDAAGRPFLAAADRAGRRLPFAIAWGTAGDSAGGLVARAAGPGAKLVQGTIDSADVYSALYYGLFGRVPGATAAR